jgi:cytochrome P450
MFWSDVTVCHVDTPDAPVNSEAERYAELQKMAAAMKALWDERAGGNAPRFDLISMLAHSDATRNIDFRELLATCSLLIVGGNDTTRNSMSGGVWGLSQFPEQYQKLRRNPELVQSLVSEIIRWHTPVLHLRRTALADFELGGKTIRKGDKVAMWFVSGNRDEEAIKDPHDLIVDRPRAREHISFGFGVHRCVGNRLAELQLRILWEEILKRDLEIGDRPADISAFEPDPRGSRAARADPLKEDSSLASCDSLPSTPQRQCNPTHDNHGLQGSIMPVIARRCRRSLPGRR